jgi:hypothetical protein
MAASGEASGPSFRVKQAARLTREIKARRPPRNYFQP